MVFPPPFVGSQLSSIEGILNGIVGVNLLDVTSDNEVSTFGFANGVLALKLKIIVLFSHTLPFPLQAQQS